MGRENTKRYSNKTSLAGVAGSALEPTKTQSNADVKSNESGVGAVAGDFSHLVYDQPKQKVKEPDYFGKGWVDWFKPYSLDKNPTVNPETQDQDTNNTDPEKTPKVNNGADAGADSDVQGDQSHVYLYDIEGYELINGKYVKIPDPTSNGDNGKGSGRFDNGSDNGSGFADPNIVRLNEALIRQQENMELIAQQMQANTDAQKAYADKVNTSLMSEINGLYEANGKQNELNDLIIDATNQKWMTQLGDEIVPIQSQNAFKQPLPLKQFDVSSITGSKYFIFIVVGIIALIGLSMLKGKGSGSGSGTGVNVTRYG